VALTYLLVLGGPRSSWLQEAWILHLIHSEKRAPTPQAKASKWALEALLDTSHPPLARRRWAARTHYLTGKETRLNVLSSYEIREIILTSRH
jgi:hypothetical protein